MTDIENKTYDTQGLIGFLNVFKSENLPIYVGLPNGEVVPLVRLVAKRGGFPDKKIILETTK